jgi:hypothetical protein
MDLAIDLRRLFSVNLNPFEPEITTEVEAQLRENGWVERKNVFGPCLVAPKGIRNKLIPALAKAILQWKITSNQSRTFSLMETLAVTVSNNANKVASSIRAKLIGDGEKVMPIIEEELDGVKTFVTLPAAGYVLTTQEKATAMDEAKTFLIEQLSAFDYENQLND